MADRDWRRYTQLLPAGQSASESPTAVELLTDVSDKQAKQILQDLGFFSQLVDEFVQPFTDLARGIAPALAGSRVDPAGTDRLEIVMLARRRDFTRLFRPSHFAAFTLPTLQKTVLVVGPLGGKASLREHILHEYVHYRLRRDVPGGLPLWFEEGLATFLSKVQFDDDEIDPAQLAFELNYSLGFWVPSNHGVLLTHNVEPIERLPLLIARRELKGMKTDDVRRFYRTAHGFVRYLYLVSGVKREQLARSLVLDDPGFPDGAGVDLLTASRSVRQLFKGGNFDLLRARVNLHKAPVGDPVPAAAKDVRRTLAESALMMNPAAAEKLFASHLHKEPGAIAAWVGQANALRLQGKTDAAKQILAQAQTLAADDPTVLLEQAALASSGCIVRHSPDCGEAWLRAKDSLSAALEADPDNFEAIYRLGIAQLYSGSPGTAQGYLEIAWQRVPWSPRVNFFLGESMRLLGDSRARWYLTNAQRWASNAFYRAAAEAALARLEQDQ